MSVTLKVDGPTRRTLSFSIERATLQAEIERRVQSLARRAQFKGFRPGHTPVALVRKAYGKDVTEDARRTLMSQAFEAAVREHKLHPVGEPELNLQALADEGDGPFTFELAVEVVPDFELKDLTSIPVSIQLPAATDAMISGEVERFRKQAASVQEAPADEPAGDDSVLGATITYIVDGQAHDPRPDRTVFVKHDLVDAINIPGSGAAFRGAKPGDVVELEADLPAHFEPADLAGRHAALKVSITSHRKVVVPLSDELLAKAGLKTEDDLRMQIRQALEQQRAQVRAEQVDRAVEGWLVDQHTMPMPERLLAKVIDRRVHEVAHRMMEQQGLSADDGHRKAEEQRERIVQAAQRSLHASFILARIAREQSLGSTTAEAEEQVRLLARSQNQDPDTVLGQARAEGWLQDVAATVTESKTREWPRARAAVTEAAEQTAGA